MQLIGLARLGKDAEIRKTGSGESVVSLSLSYAYGRKKEGEKYRPSQWVEGALWGKLADALEPYLKKGQMVCVTLDDVHIEEYPKRDGGTGTKLVGRVTAIELAGGRDESPAQPAARPANQTAPQSRPTSSSTPDDMDDDIPF